MIKSQISSETQPDGKFFPSRNRESKNDILQRTLNSLHFGEVEGEEHPAKREQRRHFSLLVITPTENLKRKQFYDPSSNMNIKIPKPISGGLILSYKCNAECQHCMYACSPKWKDDWISKNNLYKILEQLADKIEPSPYGSNDISLNFGLHFTGGEPFLNYKLLCEAVDMASDLNIPSTFVETNGYWAVNDDITKDKLNLLKKKGLKGILISVNPFYLEYVPFERTERAVRISHEIFGEDMMVYQFEYYRRFRRLGIKDKMSFNDFINIEKGEDFAKNAEFFITGRAAYTLKLQNIFPRYQANHLCKDQCKPPFLRNWHNHFDNYGNFIPGYCSGISLGDCRELDKLLEKGISDKEYPILKFLINDDFEGLLSFAKEYGYCENQQGYLSKCHLCIDIRKYLSYKNEFKELEPKEFYLHLE